MVQYIAKLSKLETLRIKNGFWLTREDVELIFTGCSRLERANFRESGMKRNLGWARKGSRHDILQSLQAMGVTSEPRCFTETGIT